MSGGLVGRQVCACEVNSGEGMLAGGESVVQRMKFGEASVVGGNDVFWMFSSGGRASARRRASAPLIRVLIGRQSCAGDVNSGEGMLAGG